MYVIAVNDEEADESREVVKATTLNKTRRIKTKILLANSNQFFGAYTCFPNAILH